MKTIAVVMVMIMAFWLRYQNHATVPLPGQSLDEYSYSWVGLSLIRLGMPVGISGIGGYPFSDMRYINVDRVFQSTAENNPVSINYPWFDHPPLLGLLSGGYAYLRGARVFEETSSWVIRKPMVVLGTITVLLVFALAAVNFGYLAGLISAIIYATMPLAVVGSRMVQGENGVIPMWLLSLLGLSLFLKKKNYRWLITAAIAAGIATLFKLSGIVAIISGLVILGQKKKFKEMVVFGAIALSWTSLFVIYGMVYDWETFVNVWRANTGRVYNIGAAAFYNLMVQIKLTHDKTLTDAWTLAGWIAWFLAIKKSILAIPVVSYLAVYILLGSHPYGWYALPFWPILTIALGKTLVDCFKEKRILTGLLLLLIPLGQNITKLVEINDFQKYATWWRVGVVGVLLGILWRQKTSRVLLVAGFLAAVYLNWRYLGLMNIDFWYKVN